MAASTPSDARAVDATTLATIEVSSDPFFRQDVLQLESITQFAYSYDVMQMGDVFSVTVPDPRGRYVGKLRRGHSIRFYMANSNVQNGARTKKVTGVITQREVATDPGGGTVIRLTGADLGWHLVNNDAPLWYNLRGTSLDRLATACIFPQDVFKGETDPGWGFADEILHSNTANRSTKTHLKFSESERLSFVAQAASGPCYVQVQPGQKMADLVITYARRAGLMAGVSADGHFQYFLPDYSTEAAQVVRFYVDDSKRSQNNVQSARHVESLEQVYTHVTVVGENPIFQLVGDGGISRFDPQFKKYYGRAKDTTLLPFRRRAVMTEGEIVSKPERRAQWHINRGLFESETFTYSLRGHYQNGRWWEADTMVEVHDERVGFDGLLYVASVQCSRDMSSGDVTTLTLKRPNLLTEIPI